MKHLIALMRSILFACFLCVSFNGFAQQTDARIVNFAADDDQLDQTAKNFLNDILDGLDRPYPCYRVHLRGHTDADGADGYNLALSRRRAENVSDYLRALGIPPHNIDIDFSGEQQPVADNATDDGRFHNRRVEIRFEAPAGHCDKPFGFDVAFASFDADAEQAADFTYQRSGTRIHIPAGALVDAQGKTVTGKVTYSYREWRDAAEFLTSGIPMDFPSKFSGSPFHSGGMFELRARKDDAEVYLRPGAQVDLDFVLADTTGDYDLYSYDDGSGNWTNTTNPNANITVADGVTSVCQESTSWGWRRDTVQAFIDALETGMRLSSLPKDDDPDELYRTFEERWKHRDYAGVDYIGNKDRRAQRNHRVLRLVTRKKGAYTYFTIEDRKGANTELKALGNVEFRVRRKRLPQQFRDAFQRQYNDVRLLHKRGTFRYRLALKDEQQTRELRVEIVPRKRVRRSARVKLVTDAFARYKKALKRRARDFDENVKVRPEEDFWEFSKVIMEGDERCMDRDAWTKYFHASRKRMGIRYNIAFTKAKGSRAWARKQIRDYLRAYNSRITNGVSVLRTFIMPARYTANNAFDQVYQAMTRRLSVSGFGIWNCDQVRRLRNPVALSPVYKDGKGNRITGYSISIIDRRINGVMSFFPQNLTYDPDGARTFLLFGADGRRYILDREGIAKIDYSSAKSPVLVMQDITDSVESVKDLRKALNL